MISLVYLVPFPPTGWIWQSRGWHEWQKGKPLLSCSEGFGCVRPWLGVKPAASVSSASFAYLILTVFLSQGLHPALQRQEPQWSIANCQTSLMSRCDPKATLPHGEALRSPLPLESLTKSAWSSVGIHYGFCWVIFTLLSYHTGWHIE